MDRDPWKMDTARREARMGKEVYLAKRSHRSSIGHTAGGRKGPEDRKADQVLVKERIVRLAREASAEQLAGEVHALSGECGMALECPRPVPP